MCAVMLGSVPVLLTCPFMEIGDSPSIYRFSNCIFYYKSGHLYCKNVSKSKNVYKLENVNSLVYLILLHMYMYM
jgi:hypothetical protein